MSETLRFENYQLLRNEDGSVCELGRGAMGVTYKAFDTDLHCNVALKVINPGILGESDIRERFLREARAAARLRHPNIATVYRLGRAADDTYFYAMEFCEGPTLAQAVARRGSFSANDAVSIAWQVSKALILAEENQLLHRDLKPANMILTERPDEGLVVKLIDFGLAKSFAVGHESMASSGSSGFVGTAHFASPEQLEEKELDIRSDIYSLGVCLWFMLTGKPPFEGSLARVMSHALTSEPPWYLLDGQPEPVVLLLRNMLAKQPEERPPNALALRQELEECYQSLNSLSAETKFSRSTQSSVRVSKTEAFTARFSIGRPIGNDTMGRIFHATDTANNGKPVLVRSLAHGLVAVPTLSREIETRVVAAIKHPHSNLLVPLAYTCDSQGFFIALPRTEGFVLLELLKQRGALSPAEALILLDPLGRATDHAVRHGIAGLNLSKGQIVVHFSGGLTDTERAQLLTSPVDQWPAWEIKADVISTVELTAERDASFASMATIAPATGAGATFSPVKSLANLAREMLGSVDGSDFAPIARLNENANAVLRRAVIDENAFPNSVAFIEEFREAIGRAGSSVPAMRKNPPLTNISKPASSFSFNPLGMASLVFLLIIGLGAGYYFGIHQPRERDREKRSEEADKAATDLTEKQKLAEAQVQNAKEEAGKSAREQAAKQGLAAAEQERIQAEAERQKQALATETERMKAEAEKAKAEAERAKAELEKARLQIQANSTQPFSAPSVGASATPESRTPEKSWDKPHIYLQLANESQRQAAIGLKKQLEKSGCVVVGIDCEPGNPGIPATSSEVRYFTPSDSGEAHRLANELAAFFGDTGVYADLPPDMPHVSHARQYEIWFASAFSTPTLTHYPLAAGMGTGGYEFPEVSHRRLVLADVSKLSIDQVWRWRNEIFARYGFIFATDRGRSLANSLGNAYVPLDSDQSRVFRRMTPDDQSNVELLQTIGNQKK